MTLDEVTQWLVALAAAFGTVWAAWSRVWLKHVKPFVLHLRRQRAENGMLANSMRYNRLLSQMGAWRNQTGAMRVLCLIARNNGSTWAAHDTLKVSVVSEVADDMVPRVFERWENWVCDPPYRVLLNSVQEAGERGVILDCRKMPDSTLRDYYLAQGVAGSVVFKAFVTEKAEMFYVSLNFGRPLEADEEGLPIMLTEDEISTYMQAVRMTFDKKDEVPRMAAKARRLLTAND